MKVTGLLLLVLLAVPASARVLSYAPYSDRITRSGNHERTTRWFLLSEETPTSREVVLYDSTGAHEPRVVSTGFSADPRLAVYERKNAPDAPPILLVDRDLSIDGGLTWKSDVLAHHSFREEPWDFDTGGPFVHGLTASLLPGTDDVPFVLGSDGWFSSIVAVRATGEAVTLFEYGTLIGRNAAGDRFLIHTEGEIRTLDLAGNTTFVADAEWWGRYSGWLTGDGSVYLLASHWAGRILSFHRNGERQFIAGPPGMEPSSESGWSFPAMGSFAVPTHDFEGAWIIQRAFGAPTTLSRHTREQGLQVMWSDPSGPEVEALIAGASGSTLLIQVHRDRPGFVPTGLRTQFVDPALAVWKVGDPMPASYDELYVREEWNKGFIHVDVDRMEAGDPFVFHSGVLDPPPGDVIFSSGGGGGDVIQEWGAVRASLRQHLVLPGVARTRGAFGSQWFTDVTIYNPLDEVQEVAIRFAAIGEDDARTPFPGRSRTIALAPQEIRVLDDVLHLFGVDNGGGTLHVLPAKNVNVNSRTYSRSAEGTYGFGMDALDFFNAAGARFPLTFTGAFPGQDFRTNVLLTDTSGRGVEAALRAHRGSTLVNGQSTIVTPASGTSQVNGIGLIPDGPIAAAQRSGALVIETLRGTTIPMVVAIDNGTNDALYVPPDRASEGRRIIPAIGHLDGAHGSRFRTDLYLFNKEVGARTIVLEVIPWDSTIGYSVSLTLQAREARMIPDALMTLFGMSGIARLRYESDVHVTSRTYNVDESGATYGCLIPPLNAFQTASQGERLEIVVAAGEGFRTNLAIVRAAERGALSIARGDIEIYDESGALLERRSFELNRQLGLQLGDILAGVDGQARRAARIVVAVRGPDPVAAYATVVDNATNDTTYYAGQLGATN